MASRDVINMTSCEKDVVQCINAYINASNINVMKLTGTSTKKNDQFETVAFKSTFGDHARKLKISSIKGVTGHSLGAAGVT